MIPSQDPYRRAQQEQADAEAAVAAQQREAERLATAQQREAERLATAQANQAAKEQEAAAKAAKEAAKEAAAAQKAATDLRNKQARADLTRKGVRHSINPVDGSPIAHETEADVASRVTAAEQAKRQQKYDDTIRSLETEHDYTRAEAERQGFKPLPRNQSGERPLETKALPALKQQALFALQSKLQQQAKTTDKAGWWDVVNNQPTPEATAAQERLTRLSQPDAQITEDDLAELEMDDATKPTVAKIRDIQARLAKDDELSQAASAHQSRIASLKLRRDAPDKWLEAERKRRAAMPPEELAQDLETSSADLTQRRAALEEKASALNGQIALHSQQLDTIEAEASQRRQQGLTAGEIVTYTLPDGTSEAWPRDLAAKREELHARLQDTQAMQQDDWTRLKLEEQDLRQETGLLIEASQHLNKVHEVNRAQQIDTGRRRLMHTPGMEQTATELDALRSEAEKRMHVLAEMYPDGVPPEAAEALQQDIAAKAEAAQTAGQQRLTKAMEAYSSIQKQIADKPDTLDVTDFYVAARQQLAADTGITEQEARRLIDDAAKMDWDQVTADEMNSGLVPESRKTGWRFKPGSWAIEGGNATQADDARKTRILSNGAVIVHPRLSSEKDYMEAVKSSTASPEAKQDAIERYPEIRAAQAKQTLETIQHYQKVLGEDSTWKAWEAKRPKDVTPEEWALQFTEKNKAATEGALGSMLAKTKQFGTGLLQSVADLVSQSAALGAGILGSNRLTRGIADQELMALSQRASRSANALDEQKDIYGQTSDNFFTRGIFNQLPRLAGSLVPAAGGAKIAMAATRGFAATKLGARFLPALAAVVNKSETMAQMVKSVDTLRRAGMAGAAAAGGAQSYSAQLGDIYTQLRTQNPELSHTEALQQAQMPAVWSGLSTALLTLTFGSKGIERFLTRPKEAKELVAKVFTSRMQQAGLVGKEFIKGGAWETLEEAPDEAISQMIAAAATAKPGQENAAAKAALVKFIEEGLPELAVATGILGGLGQGAAAYQDSHVLPENERNPANLPETVATAWTAIDNHLATDPTTGQVDNALTEQQQRRADLALSLAQGGELFDVEAANLAAAGWTRDGSKFKPLKDYTGPQVLDIDSGGLPVIKDSYIQALRDNGLAPVADAIGMTETQTRNFYAQRTQPQPPGQTQPGPQQPQPGAAQSAAPDPRGSTTQSPVQNPAVQGTQPPPSGQPAPQSGNAVKKAAAAGTDQWFHELSDDELDRNIASVAGVVNNAAVNATQDGGDQGFADIAKLAQERLNRLRAEKARRAQSPGGHPVPSPAQSPVQNPSVQGTQPPPSGQPAPQSGNAVKKAAAAGTDQWFHELSDDELDRNIASVAGVVNNAAVNATQDGGDQGFADIAKLAQERLNRLRAEKARRAQSPGGQNAGQSADHPASSIQHPETPADFLANHLAERGLPRAQAEAAAKALTESDRYKGKTYEEIITDAPHFTHALEDLGITGSLDSRFVDKNPLKMKPGGKLEAIQKLRAQQSEEAKRKAESTEEAARQSGQSSPSGQPTSSQNVSSQKPANPFAQAEANGRAAAAELLVANIRAKLAAKEISDQDAARAVAKLDGAKTEPEFVAAVVKHLGWKESRAQIAAHLHFGTKDDSAIPIASAGRASNRTTPSLQNSADPSRQGPDTSLAADPSPLRKNRAYAAAKLRLLAGTKDPSKKAWRRQFFVALEQSLQRHHLLYDAYAVGGPARRHLDGQMTAVLEVEGKITRLMDLDAMVAQFDYLQSPQDALRATGIEEDIHAQVLQLAREKPETYGYTALRQQWQKLPTELKQTVWQAYRAANQNTASADEAIMPELTAVQEWHMMNEFLRMLVQDASFAGAITETVDTASGLIGWVQTLLRDLSKLLKNLMKKVQPDLRAQLDRQVAEISARLRQIEQASAAQKDRLAVLPSLRDPAAYAATVLEKLGTSENAGILSDAALARVFDHLDSALQSRAFALHTAGDPTRPPTPTPPRRASKSALMHTLLSHFLGSRRQARQLLDTLAGITDNASGSKSSNLLAKITARFRDKTTEELLAAQSPATRKDLANLLASTLHAIGGFESASWVHGIAANPAANAILQEEEPEQPPNAAAPAPRSRRWLLAQTQRPLRPGTPPKLTPGLTPPPPAPSARQQAQARQDQQQLQNDLLRLIEQEEAANLNGHTLVSIRAEIDDYEMTDDERTHYDARTAAGRQALRQVYLARQHHARLLRQQHAAELQQAIQAARGDAAWESLVNRVRGLVLFARAYATRKFIFTPGRFATATQPAAIGGWRLYRQSDWKLIGSATQRKFADFGVAIDINLGTLSAAPDSDFAVATTRDPGGYGALSHLILKQEALDDIATYLPATAAYLQHSLGSEADQRQRLGLANATTSSNPQTTASDVSQEPGEAPRQPGSIQSASSESGLLPPTGQSQRGDAGKGSTVNEVTAPKPTFTPLAEDQSPFSQNQPEESATETPVRTRAAANPTTQTNNDSRNLAGGQQSISDGGTSATLATNTSAEENSLGLERPERDAGNAGRSSQVAELRQPPRPQTPHKVKIKVKTADGNSQNIKVTFPSAEAQEIYQWYPDFLRSQDVTTSESESTKLKQKNAVLVNRLMQRTGENEARVKARLRDYHAEVKTQAQKDFKDLADDYRAPLPPYSGSSQARVTTSAKALPAPEGGDVIEALKLVGASNISTRRKTATSGELDWYQSVINDARRPDGKPHTQPDIILAVKAADAGDLSSPLAKLIWMQGTATTDGGDILTEANARYHRPGNVMAAAGMPIDIVLDHFNERTSSSPYRFESTSDLGEAILAAVDARVAARQSANAEPDFEAENEATTRNFQTLLTASAGTGRTMSGQAIADYLRDYPSAAEDTLAIGDAWFAVQVDPDFGLQLTADDALYGQQTVTFDQTLPVRQINDQPQQREVTAGPNHLRINSEPRTENREQGTNPETIAAIQNALPPGQRDFLAPSAIESTLKPLPPEKLATPQDVAEMDADLAASKAAGEALDASLPPGMQESEDLGEDADAWLDENAALSAATRSRRDATFDPGIKTPFGTVLRYSWMHRQEDVFNPLTGEVELQRVSDWDKALTNAETGREIVHHFTVARPDGTTQTVSLETALGTMTAEQKKTTNSIIRALRRLPVNEALLAHLKAKQASHAAAVDDAYATTWEQAPAIVFSDPDFPALKDRGVKAAYIGKTFVGNFEPSELPLSPSKIHSAKLRWALENLSAPKLSYDEQNKLESLPRLIKKDREALRQSGTTSTGIPTADPTGQLSLFASNRREILADGPSGTVQGQTVRTGSPVTFRFLHNKQSATKIWGKPKKDSDFDRGFEPSGRYVSEVSDPDYLLKNFPGQYEAGTLTFENPIVIAGGTYGEPTSWKRRLSALYGNTRGKRLSQAILADGYDGVITLSDRGNPSEILDLTTFDESKALYSSNRLAEVDPQGYFSLDAGGFDTSSQKSWSAAEMGLMEESTALASAPRLAAFHNLSPENLAYTDRMGGLAVPSIAVLPEGQAISGFGSITLIGTRDLVDPKKNPVFDADAYTSRFPDPEYKRARTADAQALVNKLRPFERQFEDSGITGTLWDNAVNNPNPQDSIQRLQRSLTGKAAFLAEQGTPITPVMMDKPIGAEWVLEPSFAPYRANPALISQLDANDEPANRTLAQAIRAAIGQYVRRTESGARVAQVLIDSYINKDTGLPLFGRTLGIEKSLDAIGKQQVDTAATKDQLDAALAGREASFQQWAERQVLPMMGDPRLTLKGRKVPYTLDNIVQAMTSARVRGGENVSSFFGEGAARGSSATRFKDMEKMRSAAAVQIMPEEQVSAARETAKKLLADWREAVASHTTLTNWKGQPDIFGAFDASMRAIARWAKGSQTPAALRSALQQEDFANVPDALIEQGQKAAEAFAAAPVPYFESKPQRAVLLNEFIGAVIPDSEATGDTAAILQRHSIPFRTYTGETSQQSTAAQFAQDLAEKGALFSSNRRTFPLDRALRPAAPGKGLASLIPPASSIQHPASSFEKAYHALPASQRHVEPGFYSKLESVVTEKLPAKGNTPAQVIALLTNNGVKQDEIKWSGLVPWLQQQAQDGPINRQQVLDYLATEGSVKFTVTRLNSISADEDAEQSRIYERYRELTDQIADLRRQREEGALTPSEASRELSRLSAERSTLDDRLNNLKHRIQSDQTRNTQWTLPGGTNPQEVVITWNQPRTANREPRTNSPNTDTDRTHYGDLDALAWYRTTDRTNDAGPGLLVEEFQSKWHQHGREKGYRETMQMVPGVFGGMVPASPEEAAKVPDAPYRASWPIMLFKRALLDAVQSGKQWIGWTTGDTQADRYDLSKQVKRIDARKFDQTRYEIAVLDKNDHDVRLPKEAFTAEELPEIVGKDLAARIVNDLRFASPSRVMNYTGLDLRVGGQGMRKFYDDILVKEFAKYVKPWGGKVENRRITTKAQEMVDVPRNPTNGPAFVRFEAEANTVHGIEPGGRRIRVSTVGGTGPLSDMASQIASQAAQDYNQKLANAETPIHLIRITPQMRESVTAGQSIFASNRRTFPLDRALRPAAPGKGLASLIPPASSIQHPASSFEKAYHALPASQRHVEPGFYSKLESVVTEKLPAKGNTPAQVIALLTNNGVKQDEIKWSGIEPWLAAQSGKIDKQAVLDYLATEGAVTFEEVRLGNNDSWSSKHNEVQKQFEKVGIDFTTTEEGTAYFYRGSDGESLEPDEMNKRQRAVYDKWFTPLAQTKYAEYQLPGGENYREVVVAMPEGERGFYTKAPDVDTTGWTLEVVKRRSSTMRDLIVRDATGAERGMLRKWNHSDEQAINQVANPKPRWHQTFPEVTYKSSHFSDVPNYLAHYRANDRVDANGKPGTLLEELQSDRHQAGREKGYSNTLPEGFKVVKIGDGYRVEKPDGQLVQTARKPADNEKSAVEDALRAMGNTGSLIPDAPYRSAWPLMLFKRALADAVASGKNWIGWTVGDTQVERYDLSKQVEYIDYREKSGRYELGIVAKNGKPVDLPKSDYSATELEDVVGKEVAQKIVNGEGQAGGGRKTLRGDNLKVGGEGMKGFYDSILTKEIGKYVKQWGAGVVKGSINADNFPYKVVQVDGGWRLEKQGWQYETDRYHAGTWDEKQAAHRFADRLSNATPIWRVDITPQMRESVTAGQSIFASNRRTFPLDRALRPAAPGKGLASLIPPASSIQHPASSFEKAYHALLQGSSTVWQPLKAVYNRAKASDPTLTPAAFMREAKARYDAGTLFLEPPERSETVESLKPFILRNSLGVVSTHMALPAAVRKTTAAQADMQAQATWLDATAKARGFASADDLAVKDPELFRKLTTQWRITHSRDSEGKFVQTAAINAIFTQLHGSKNTKTWRLDESGNRARSYASEAHTHSRGTSRPGQSGPASSAPGDHRAEKALLVDWARDAGLLLHKLPEEFTPHGKNDMGNMEHHVFFIGDEQDPGRRVIKITREGHYGIWPVPHLGEFDLRNSASSPSRYLQRILDTNARLADDIVLHGVLADRQGNVQIITSQPVFSGEKANKEWSALPEDTPVEQKNIVFHAAVAKVREAFAMMGFQPISNDNRTYYRPADNTAIFDAHLSNLMWVDSTDDARYLVPFDVTVMHPAGELRENFQRMAASDESKPLRFEHSLSDYALYHLNSPGGTLPSALRSPLATQVATAAARTNTNATPAQRDAENYETGKVNVHGLRLSIENPAGSVRSGTDADGKPWSVTMPHHYGRILGTVGRDKDHLDFFLGPNPDSQLVLIVNQRKPGNGHFDEHKVMLGFNTPAEAARGYLASYTKGWKGLQSAIPTTIPVLKHWLTTHDTTQPVTQEQIQKLAQTLPLPSSPHDKPALASSDRMKNPAPVSQSGAVLDVTISKQVSIRGPKADAVLPAVESVDSFQSAPERPATEGDYSQYGEVQAKKNQDRLRVAQKDVFFAKARLKTIARKIEDAEREGAIFEHRTGRWETGSEIVVYHDNTSMERLHVGFRQKKDGSWEVVKPDRYVENPYMRQAAKTLPQIITADSLSELDAFLSSNIPATQTTAGMKVLGITIPGQWFVRDHVQFPDGSIWNPMGRVKPTTNTKALNSQKAAAQEKLIEAEAALYLAEEEDAGRTDRLAAMESAAEWARRTRAAEFAALLDARDEQQKNAASFFVAEVWQAYAQHDEAFQFGKSASKDADDIAAAVSLPGRQITVQERGDTLRFMGPNGYLDVNDIDTPKPYIRSTEASSKGKKGGGGTQLYQAALDWIHNNGKRITDDSGLTDINSRRRTSNFFSSALRWGTTRHLKPHDNQKLKWTKSDTRNIAALATREMEFTFKAIAEAREWSYDFTRDTFLDATGSPIDQQRFNDAVLSHHPGESGVGVATLERAIITRSALEAFQRGETESVVSQIGSRENLPDGLTGVLYASNRLGTAITKSASAVASITQRTLEVANHLTDALGIQQPLATFGSNNLDKRLAAKLDQIAGPKVRSAKTAVETWLDKPDGLSPTIKGLVDQVLPTALIPREWLALHHEMQRKSAFGQETANDLIRALSGNPRLSDLAYPKEFSENPAARAQLFDAMEGRIPMATLPPAMQRLGERLRDLLRQTGADLVRQGLMNPDTFAELQSTGWMPRYTEDEARESAGSFLAAFKLGVRDLLQQRSTAYHIVDTTRKDKTGQYVTVSRDEGGKRNRWRFRDAASRDAFYHDFVRKQTLDMLQDRSDKTVADMLAPLSRGDKAAMRDQIKSLTVDQIANTAKISPMLAGIVKQAKKHQYDRFLPKDPFEPAKLIKDPVYAVARYVLGQTHNAATMELLRKTAQNPEWTSDIPLTGFEAIPDASRFGPLAGKHVRKDIARQILDLVDVPNAALQFYDGILRKWKAGKLVWNPGSHVRDAVGNTMFAYLAGSSIWNPGNWPYYQQAIAALRTGGTDFAELIEQQVIGGDAYTGLVKERLRGLLPDPKTVEGYDPGFVQRMMFGFGATLTGSHEFLSNIRRLPDDLFKAAAYFKAKSEGRDDLRGVPLAEDAVRSQAAAHVRKWFPYYDRLGQSGTTRAVGRFVNPFVSFFRESTRILGTAVVERPLALTASLAFPALITAISAMMLGLDDDDMEEIKKDMAGKGKLFATDTSLFSMLLPFRSAQGAVQQFDISAVMPFADLLGTRVVVTDADEDPWNRFWRGIIAGGPVLSLVDAWRHNEDAFTRRPIAEFGMTPLEKIKAYTKHAAGVALPPLAPGGTAFNTLTRAGDRATNKTLETYDPTQAVIRSVVGLNVKNATPDLYRLADDWRKAHGYEVQEGMDYGSTTPASRARKALFAQLAQDEPNLTAISNILKSLDKMGHPVRTEQDINRLLFYRDPAKLIGGNKARGITPADAQAQFRASLQGEARQAFENALQEFQRIKSKAPTLIRQATLQ